MKIGDKITEPFWVDGTENVDDIVISTPNPFDTQMWISTMEYLEKIRGALPKSFWQKLRARKGKGMSFTLIPLLTSIKEELKTKKTVTVLDFGGGIGDNYYEFFRTNQDIQKRVKFIIVDLKVNCQKGSEKFKDYNNVTFMINDSEHKMELIEYLKNNKIDILHFHGCLQYIIPYKEDLKMALTSCPNKVIFVRTPFTDREKTFYCRQKICAGIGEYEGRYLGDIKSAVISKLELSNFLNQYGYSIEKANNHIVHSGYAKGLPDFGDIYYENIIFCKTGTVQS